MENIIHRILGRVVFWSFYCCETWGSWCLSFSPKSSVLSSPGFGGISGIVYKNKNKSQKTVATTFWDNSSMWSEKEQNTLCIYSATDCEEDPNFIYISCYILNPIVPTGYIQLTYNFKWGRQKKMQGVQHMWLSLIPSTTKEKKK